MKSPKIVIFGPHFYFSFNFGKIQHIESQTKGISWGVLTHSYSSLGVTTSPQLCHQYWVNMMSNFFTPPSFEPTEGSIECFDCDAKLLGISKVFQAVFQAAHLGKLQKLLSSLIGRFLILIQGLLLRFARPTLLMHDVLAGLAEPWP